MIPVPSTNQTSRNSANRKKSRSFSILAVGSTIAWVLVVGGPGAARAGNWACEVALCISNPAGPMAVSECVPPISRLYRHLKRGGSFPLCQSADGYVNFTRYGIELQQDCPPGTETVYHREQPGEGGHWRWRYCERFVPVDAEERHSSWQSHDRGGHDAYVTRMVDGRRVVGEIVTTRAALRDKPRYLEYVVNGDKRRIWW